MKTMPAVLIKDGSIGLSKRGYRSNRRPMALFQKRRSRHGTKGPARENRAGGDLVPRPCQFFAAAPAALALPAVGPILGGQRNRGFPPGGSMRILLAEDDRELATWVARLLRRDNYVIDCIYRGDEADAALAIEDYALVVLDIGLPHLDGVEVLRRLRARGST